MEMQQTSILVSHQTMGKDNYQFYASSRQPGVSMEESIQIYDQWAEVYDLDCPMVGYNGPKFVSMAMADYYPVDMRDKIRVIDVAAGTGLVGKELVKLGFRWIDALEPSAGMLKKLGKLNIYNQIFQDCIGSHQVASVATNTYDCLTISGGLGTGHIPVTGLDEFVRMVKPGGTIFIAIMEEHLTSSCAGNERLETYMEQLEAQSCCWKIIQRTIVENYTVMDPGVIFGFQVMTDSV